MTAGRRSATLLVTLFLGGCAGGHPPLATIQRIPGSTQEGGAAASHDTLRPIRRIDGTAAPTAGTIRPLHDSADAAPTAGEIIPLRDTSAVEPVEGTSWTGSNVDGALTLEFLAGGSLRYTTPNGTYTNGTWQQHAHTITFEMNSHFADYSGRIHGTRMNGQAHNTQGRSWAWEAARQ